MLLRRAHGEPLVTQQGSAACCAQHVCVMQGHRERTVIVFVLTAHVPISDP